MLWLRFVRTLAATSCLCHTWTYCPFLTDFGDWTVWFHSWNLIHLELKHRNKWHGGCCVLYFSCHDSCPRLVCCSRTMWLLRVLLFFTVRHGSGLSVPSAAWRLAAGPSVSSQTDGSSCLRSDRISSLMIKDRCSFTLFFLENKPRPPHVFSQ